MDHPLEHCVDCSGVKRGNQAGIVAVGMSIVQEQRDFEAFAILYGDVAQRLIAVAHRAFGNPIHLELSAAQYDEIRKLRGA